ncbi:MULTISPECIES: hypothetical protein [unclassified Paenibacillus]|uniref:hypothetical protein n=1 Tax=unclassified Paenibacillus TaxID=185978 RepID=UPI002407345D|nr:MULTISPECIES: hypothetical protein [unclassified Paenibacillus]MDF9844173.1 crossover junction endodeoxyribonuclease RuvC [Paenibacillus sp. PastF-2]MDF9850705.1 crossover junction endodeoxyribonuclease RuvC [Paenibacillus sp. PastM-2]MDF9857276.1 crossover junction endodeoxyribonuclease RuvC [Paenibacillus sp. PastF-1]MDH6482616.1 crossover junction endodeoxyribonuclease RuvC [Paenibacillus sp. PastH-2]MDH6510043.1 crossover junction endodeoxyribonuclease RuvC [Paenibacillus sp. PastM-3]
MTRFIGIDPATHTGFVAIGSNGRLAGWTEFVGKGDTAPARINMVLDEVYRHLKPDDDICIEGFAMEAKHDTNKVSSGFNWAARLAVDRRGSSFIVATPNQLKKFVNVSEWEGVAGSKVRLEGKAVKRLVMAAVESHWGDIPRTENIADAYVLARIAEAIYKVKQGQELEDYPQYQQEVIMAIIDPALIKKLKKESKANKRPRKPAAATSHTQIPGQGLLF